jgi:hypothetical protein
MDANQQVKVKAVDPIKYGDENGVTTNIQPGDTFVVTLAQARDLLSTGSVDASDNVKKAVAELKDAEAEAANPTQPTAQEVDETLTAVETPTEQ